MRGIKIEEKLKGIKIFLVFLNYFKKSITLLKLLFDPIIF